jgi:hypothetical protein
MAANIDDQKLLERLSRDPDTDLRMWVACNPMTPQTVSFGLAVDDRRDLEQIYGLSPEIAAGEFVANPLNRYLINSPMRAVCPSLAITLTVGVFTPEWLDE